MIRRYFAYRLVSSDFLKAISYEQKHYVCHYLNQQRLKFVYITADLARTLDFGK